jgi:hypothetical protein
MVSHLVGNGYIDPLFLLIHPRGFVSAEMVKSTRTDRNYETYRIVLGSKCLSHSHLKGERSNNQSVTSDVYRSKSKHWPPMVDRKEKSWFRRNQKTKPLAMGNSFNNPNNLLNIIDVWSPVFYRWFPNDGNARSTQNGGHLR